MKFKGLLVCVVGLGLLTVSSAARTEVGPEPQQDVIRLETRINQLEQRLYSIDSNLRNLEQQLRLAGSTVARRGCRRRRSIAFGSTGVAAASRRARVRAGKTG